MIVVTKHQHPGPIDGFGGPGDSGLFGVDVHKPATGFVSVEFRPSKPHKLYGEPAELVPDEPTQWKSKIPAYLAGQKKPGRGRTRKTPGLNAGGEPTEVEFKKLYRPPVKRGPLHKDRPPEIGLAHPRGRAMDDPKFVPEHAGPACVGDLPPEYDPANSKPDAPRPPRWSRPPVVCRVGSNTAPSKPEWKGGTGIPAGETEWLPITTTSVMTPNDRPVSIDPENPLNTRRILVEGVVRGIEDRPPYIPPAITEGPHGICACRHELRRRESEKAPAKDTYQAGAGFYIDGATGRRIPDPYRHLRGKEPWTIYPVKGHESGKLDWASMWSDYRRLVRIVGFKWTFAAQAIGLTDAEVFDAANDGLVEAARRFGIDPYEYDKFEPRARKAIMQTIHKSMSSVAASKSRSLAHGRAAAEAGYREEFDMDRIDTILRIQSKVDQLNGFTQALVILAHGLGGFRVATNFGRGDAYRGKPAKLALSKVMDIPASALQKYLSDAHAELRADLVDLARKTDKF